MATLTKLDAIRYPDGHPNGIDKEYTKEYDGEVLSPEVGYYYYFGSFRSSTVLEVTNWTNKGFTFKTKNSVYEVKY